MSMIWTPGGEFVPREDRRERPAPAPAQGREPTPEEFQAALAEARAVLATPVLEHIGGHAMAFFELAALHLEREAATGGEGEADSAEAGPAHGGHAGLPWGV